MHPNKVIPALKIGNTEYTWKPVNSEGETIDFTKLVGQYNYAVAYALAEIKMETPAKILVGVGSDDGIKIFLKWY